MVSGTGCVDECFKVSEVSKCIKLILLPLAVETVVKNDLTVFCICSYFIHVRLRNT